MATLDITNVDDGNVALGQEEFSDELIAVAATKTFLKGTILARRSVATAVTASAPTGTGNGTVTNAAAGVGQTVPVAGAYVLRCTAAATNGGTFRLENPSGQIVATGLQMNPGAGVATPFNAAGLSFTVTDGSTDFAVGDAFTLTVVADGKLVAYDPAGVGGAMTPCAVLTYDTGRTGAGNIAARVLVGGKVNRNRLIIDADGTGVNITSAILDQLRARSIIALTVQQLARVDNPQP